MRIYFISIVLFYLATSVIINPVTTKSLDSNQVISKMQEVYKTTPKYGYNTVYSLFKGHKSVDEHSFYTGSVVRETETMFQKIDKTEFIYGVDFLIQLNEEEKTIALYNNQKINEYPIDLNSALKNCSEVTMDLKDGYYSLTLIIKKGSDLPLNVVKMRIDDSEFYIEQLDFYFSNVQNFAKMDEKSDIHQPHLRIKFTDFTKKPKIDQQIFQLNKYIKILGSSYIVTDQYKGYQFINNQNNKQK